MIVFLNDIRPEKLRMAFNNDIVRFYSNNSSVLPIYCDITASLGFPAVRLYPDPNNHFFINFKPFVSALINTRNFEDLTQTDLDGTDPDTFLYNSTAGTFVNYNIVFTITFTDLTTDTAGHLMSWLAGVEQLGDYNAFNLNDTYVLTPFRKATANQYYLKYWQGYPFDFSLYTNNGSITLKNQTTLVEQYFNLPGIVNRMFFSDGRVDESIEDAMPLSVGFNQLRLMLNDEPADGDKFLMVEKSAYKCGVYFKWLNKYGGYSYWLFEDTAAVDRSVKSIGELDRDNNNLDDTFTRAIQIGKESQDTIKVVAEQLNEDQQRLLLGIADSPKIYMFTGVPYSQSGYRNWVEVSLKTSSVRVRNYKQSLNNFALEFDLPERYTQTL